MNTSVAVAGRPLESKSKREGKRLRFSFRDGLSRAREDLPKVIV